MSPGFILSDTPVTYEVPADEWNPEGKWEPKNFDEKYRGKVTVREAFESSLNIPAVRLIDKIGVASVIDVAKQYGHKAARLRGRWDLRSAFPRSLLLR